MEIDEVLLKLFVYRRIVDELKEELMDYEAAIVMIEEGFALDWEPTTES